MWCLQQQWMGQLSNKQLQLSFNNTLFAQPLSLPTHLLTSLTHLLTCSSHQLKKTSFHTSVQLPSSSGMTITRPGKVWDRVVKSRSKVYCSQGSKSVGTNITPKKRRLLPGCGRLIERNQLARKLPEEKSSAARGSTRLRAEWRVSATP